MIPYEGGVIRVVGLDGFGDETTNFRESVVVQLVVNGLGLVGAGS
jgi:hypothetical protein